MLRVVGGGHEPSSEALEPGIAGGLTLWRYRLRDAYRGLRGRLMNRLGLPGFIAPFDRHDLILGQHISVRVTPYNTVLNISGRDYVFDRLTGKLSGTGYALCDGGCSCRERGEGQV